jgi:FAD synthase
MVVGSSFRCGNPASSAGPAEIEKLLLRYTSSAFLKVVSPVLCNGKEVSSSLIRRCLLTGDTETASVLLGRAYQVDLEDCSFSSSGERLLYSIRTLGQLLPKEGTYMTRVAGKASGAPTSGPVDCDASAVISGDSLALELQVRMKPDRIYFL